MEDTWTARDLPVLTYLVERLDDPGTHRVDLPEIGPATGLDDHGVERAINALDSASPPYLNGIRVDQAPYPIIITSVTERARREVGAWPTAEAFVDRLVAALNQAADAETDPEKRSKIQQVAASLGGGLRDVAVNVAGTALARSMGM